MDGGFAILECFASLNPSQFIDDGEPQDLASHNKPHDGSPYVSLSPSPANLFLSL